MDLKKRLASLDRMTRKPVDPSDGQRVSTEDIAVEELGMTRQMTPGGPVFIRDYRDQVPAPENPLPDLRGFLSHPGQGSFAHEDVLFLDLETTGLAGGTGTIPFLVGTSWWEGGQFRTRQFFLCGPGGETALLMRLKELILRFSCLATYNGASFDLPLLRTRALLNRLDQPLADRLSWDLLVPVRRLWGRQLENCRQQSVEAGICGLQRDERDISGNLIPQTWFNFLQRGNREDLLRVLYHNRRDMLGMGHIFGAVVNLAHQLVSSRARKELDWHEAWALGRIAEVRGDVPLSVHWLDLARQSAARDLEAFADRRFAADAVRILKRGGNWKVVENVIACALDSGQNDYWLHREAAILFEHRLGDLNRARQHALAAGDEHRLKRLQRKLQLSTHRSDSEDPS